MPRKKTITIPIKGDNLISNSKDLDVSKDQIMQGENESIVIIGIDPSLSRTGWGIIEYSKIDDTQLIKYIDSGTISTKNDKSLPERLVYITDAISNSLNKYQPRHFVMENLFINNRSKFSGMNLAMLRGSILSCAFKNVENIEFFSYMPTTVKKHITQTGRSDKETVDINLRRYIDIPESKKLLHDEVDAIAVVICHLIRSKKIEIQDTQKDHQDA